MSGGYRPLAGVVIAAGEGTRMRSGTPKVLHPLCGRPMVLHVVDALGALPLERIVVVVGHGAERVTKTLQEQVTTEFPSCSSSSTSSGAPATPRAWPSPRSRTIPTTRATSS